MAPVGVSYPEPFLAAPSSASGYEQCCRAFQLTVVTNVTLAKGAA